MRVLADRTPLSAHFLLLGSASGTLLNRSSESLAGRVAFLEMGGFNLAEVLSKKEHDADILRRLWWRGRFPRAFLAKDEKRCREWQEYFVQSFVERDLPQLGVHTPATMLRRFWMMLAHYHGQIWNASEIAASLGESPSTTRRRLDLMTDALMIRQLHPWFENVGKRQVKSPKVYLRDTGLLHALLEIPSYASLEGNPKLGASWEGFAVEEIIQYVGQRRAYFWATQSGAELDLLLMIGGKRIGVEVKYADAPGPTKSMRIAMSDLSLDRLYVVYPGRESYDLDKKIRVVPLAKINALLTPRRS
jgi:predicted AAA+ superfamily ATPase